jgi:hypothetical protein
MLTPRVFQKAVLTIAVSKSGAAIYIGVHKLEYFHSFLINFDRELPMVSIEYSTSPDPETQLKIEEETRYLKANGWLE